MLIFLYMDFGETEKNLGIIIKEKLTVERAYNGKYKRRIRKENFSFGWCHGNHVTAL